MALIGASTSSTANFSSHDDFFLTRPKRPPRQRPSPCSFPFIDGPSAGFKLSICDLYGCPSLRPPCAYLVCHQPLHLPPYCSYPTPPSSVLVFPLSELHFPPSINASGQLQPLRSVFCEEGVCPSCSAWPAVGLQGFIIQPLAAMRICYSWRSPLQCTAPASRLRSTMSDY